MRSWREWGRALWPNDRILGINRRNLDHVFADYRPGRFAELDDKLLAKSKCEAAGIAVPRTIGTIDSPLELAKLHAWLSTCDELVLKPARGWGGRGILVLEKRGENFVTPGGNVLSTQEIEDHVRETLSGNFSLDESDDSVLIEERIHPHQFLQLLSPDGLSDLRIVLEKGKALQAMLRVPTRASDGKANLHGGGLGLGIDLESGRVRHAIQRDQPVESHPDTGVVLVGLQVPMWEECLELARRSAAVYADLDYIGVDIVLDARRGPLLLEVNARPGLAIQLANASSQPVSPRSKTSVGEHITFAATWIVFAALAIGPLAFDRWERRHTENQDRVTVVGLTSSGASIPATPLESGGSVEWSEAASEISAENADFARAKELADGGDPDQAIVYYTRAAADSSIAPFALNNVGLLHREAGRLKDAETALLKALQGHPEYARGHYNLGLVHRDLGNKVAAETDFRMALAQRPSYGRAWGELGQLLVERGVVEEGIRALNQAIRYEPTLAAYRKVLGRASLQIQDFGAATKAFREALALDPRSRVAAEGWVRSRFLAAVHGAPPLAKSTLDSMSELSERFDAQNQRLESRRLAAEVRWLAHGPGRARSILRDLGTSSDLDARRLAVEGDLALGIWSERDATTLETNRIAIDIARLGRSLETARSREEVTSAFHNRPPRDPRLRLVLLRLQGVNASAADREAGLALATSTTEDRWIRSCANSETELMPPDSLRQEALPLLLRRIESDAPLPLPQSFLIWTTARIAELEGRDGSPWHEALDRWFPDFRPAMLHRFHELVAQGEVRAARRVGLRMLADASDPTEILLPLMRLELERNRPTAARSLWKRLDTASRRAPEAQILYAELLIEEKKPKAATRRLDQVLEQVPTHIEALYLRGKALALRGKKQTAQKSFERALNEAPNRADIRSALARVLMDRRQYPAAIEEWKKVLALYPVTEPKSSALFNLALSEQRAGEIDAALADWQRFLLVDPSNYRAYYNLALAQEDARRISDAIRSLQKALELNPNHSASSKRLATLQNGGHAQ